jgi:hypothetical protein
MKKGFFILLAYLLISFLPLTRVLAQNSPQPSTEEKIEALKRKQLELNQRIIEELERQNKEKEEQLIQLKGSKGETQSPPPSPQNSLITATNRSTPEVSASGSSDGGTAAPSAPGTPQAATGNQENNKCVQVELEPSKFSRSDQAICFLARDIVDRRIQHIAPSGIDLTSDEGVLLPALFGQVARRVTVDAALKSFVLDTESSRTDKQLGADPKSSGTTSIAVKGGIPSVLSWAVENGAAVASRDGTTITFRFNPVGAAEALSGQGYISGFKNSENDPIISFFRKTSLGFSFDTTRGTDPPTLIGSKQQLSAVSFRYQFVNQRDPRHQRYRSLWDQFIAKQGLELTKQQSDQLIELEITPPVANAGFRNKDLQQWVNETDIALSKTSITPMDLNRVAAIEEVRKILEQRLAELPTSELEKDPAVINALTKFVSAYLPYLEEKKRLLKEISKGTLVTFEYTNFREPAAPDLSNFRFIMEKGTVGGFDMTANASLNFFNKRPAGLDVKRIRDFSFAAQLDKRLDDVMGLGNSTLSFAGKFERVIGNAVALDGTVLPNTKGDIAVGQIKLTIPIKDTGIKIPFSITFANRTELVREREVRGNFGFTLDFDTLFSRFKPFSK